uniref:Uncharacterized protein n=1 Tax=Populus trichocarpa TaxID=3694 RepID=A0A3N7EU98_POPTR
MICRHVNSSISHNSDFWKLENISLTDNYYLHKNHQ